VRGRRAVDGAARHFPVVPCYAAAYGGGRIGGEAALGTARGCASRHADLGTPLARGTVVSDRFSAPAGFIDGACVGKEGQRAGSSRCDGET